MQVRDLKRFDEILVVLFEEGFEYILTRKDFAQRIPLGKRLNKNIKKIFIKHKDRLGPEMLLNVFERLGPTFIKIGQMLSLRPDLIPAEYSVALEKLQDKCPEVEFSKIKTTIEHSLNTTLHSYFKHFDEKPIAAGSVSQVHIATLNTGKFKGKKVAIKVLRPGIREQMDIDIDILETIASLLEKNKDVAKYHATRILSEFKEWTESELDFTIEAMNAKFLKKNVEKNNKTAIIPEVIAYTKDVLIYEYIEGRKYTDLTESELNKLGFRKTLLNILQEVFREVFEDGFFHADPHPGNILLLGKEKFALVDFGIMGRFSEEMKEIARDFFISVMTQDSQLLIQTLERMAGKELNNLELNGKIDELMLVVSQNLEDIQMGATINKVLKIVSEYEIRIPKEFVLLGKTVATLEGVGLKYYPDFNFIKESKSYFDRLAKKQFRYELSNAKKTAIKYYKFISQLPDNLTKVMNKLEHGELKLDINDTDLKILSVEMDKSSNRIAYSAIISAFIIAGALLINVPIGQVYGVSTISAVCFGLGFLFILILFTSIFKEAQK